MIFFSFHLFRVINHLSSIFFSFSYVVCGKIKYVEKFLKSSISFLSELTLINMIIGICPYEHIRVFFIQKRSPAHFVKLYMILSQSWMKPRMNINLETAGVADKLNGNSSGNSTANSRSCIYTAFHGIMQVSFLAISVNICE